MMNRVIIAAVWCLASGGVAAFSPTNLYSSPVFQRVPATQSTARAASSALGSNKLALPSVAVPNPFKQLPWNVERDMKRKARNIKLERNKLHRDLGIPEDASYEEIVEVTNMLIAAAGKDMKQKVKIEVAKDRILQIRLNERLAGLSTVEKDARAQSTFEFEGNDDDENALKEATKEWNAPKWTQGLIVKPDEKHRNGQIRLWGIVTMLGLAVPPAQDYLGRFTWLICIAQLTFRGMPRDDIGGGGFAMSFNAGGGGSKGHRKVAFLLGFVTWIVGATLVYGLMPNWAKGQRWTASLGFTLQNLVFGVVCSYLQPYKG